MERIASSEAVGRNPATHSVAFSANSKEQANKENKQECPANIHSPAGMNQLAASSGSVLSALPVAKPC